MLTTQSPSSTAVRTMASGVIAGGVCDISAFLAAPCSHRMIRFAAFGRGSFQSDLDWRHPGEGVQARHPRMPRYQAAFRPPMRCTHGHPAAQIGFLERVLDAVNHGEQILEIMTCHIVAFAATLRGHLTHQVMRHLQPAGAQPWSAVRSSHRLNRSSIASLHPAARVCC